MKYLIAAILTLTLQGCATQQKCWDLKPGPKVCAVTQKVIDKECDAEVSDRGVAKKSWEHWGGCTRYDINTIFVDARHPNVLLHEFCHWFNTAEPEDCEKFYTWQDAKEPESSLVVENRP